MSRAAAPTAAHEVASLVTALLSDTRRPGSRDPFAPREGAPREGAEPAVAQSGGPELGGVEHGRVECVGVERVGGLEAPAARTAPTASAVRRAASAVRVPPTHPTGLGTAAARIPVPAPPQAPAPPPVPSPHVAGAPPPPPSPSPPAVPERTALLQRPVAPSQPVQPAAPPWPAALQPPAVPGARPQGADVLTAGPRELAVRDAAHAVPRRAAALGIPPQGPVPDAGPRLPTGPTGLGSSATRVRAPDAVPSRPTTVPALYCPPAVRDDPALGEEVNERLVEWAEEIGIYPGQLNRVRSAGFGRLIMLAHPESDDPDRLLAAAKCALSEWAVDDHYVDGEAEEARHELLGQRLAIAHSAIDQAHLPLRYAPQLEEVVKQEPVALALRSSLDNLAEYATTTQVRRLRHELAIMFVAYNQEGVWHTAGHTPPVWEFLMHRHENSFVPCMVLIDAVAGYELPQAEFADPAVRRAFTMAGTASVIVNDLYSMAKEDPTDFSLPRLIAAEDECSLREAVERSVEIHDELMHTYEAEASVLASAGSPQLRRFLAGVWAWLGGSREWHAGSARYSAA